MIIKLYSQNALDGFSRPDTAGEYVGIMRHINPDAAVLTEAYQAGTEAALQKPIKQIESLGYYVFHGPYDEQDDRRDRHGLLLAIRKQLVAEKKPCLTRIGKHNIIESWLQYKKNQPIHLLGMHLDDRNESRRQTELDDLLELIDINNIPTILTGDMNSAHRADAKGKPFTKARWIHLLVVLKLWPKTDPTGQPMPNNASRKGSVFYRLHEMASGKTIKRMVDAGFTDADSKHRPTYSADSPYAQLDHTLVSKHFKVKSFEVPYEGSSDHRGIVTELEI